MPFPVAGSATQADTQHARSLNNIHAFLPMGVQLMATITCACWDAQPKLRCMLARGATIWSLRALHVLCLAGVASRPLQCADWRQ
eukprot:8315064-Alexandrium_andersonii.AAC.1